MRLPATTLENIFATFIAQKEFSLLGSLSPEERCCAVPEQLSSQRCLGTKLLEVRDPADAFPDYSHAAKQKIERNRKRLKDAGVLFETETVDLLASEDNLLDIVDGWYRPNEASTMILDITSLPKRYFCFFLKRLIQSNSLRNLVVTYTQTGPDGYTDDHLAEDPMTCEHLPGYAAPLPPKGSTLVVSVGFESLSISSLLDVYRDKRKETKLLLSFPSDPGSVRREWNTVRDMILGNPRNIKHDNIEVIAWWDTEQVYKTLCRWQDDSEGLTLAPFGPKPHSLGMTLFAIKFDTGLYYTQPRSYNPDYSRGHAESWAYVVKWDGIPCFERQANMP